MDVFDGVALDLCLHVGYQVPQVPRRNLIDVGHVGAEYMSAKVKNFNLVPGFGT